MSSKRNNIGTRRRLSQAFTELHIQLRTEGDTPIRKALSIWLGTVIGCVPVYGLHLLLCVVAARLLGLSRITTYLAAHINNPLTAPILLYLSYGVGSLFFGGSWPSSIASLQSVTIWSASRDLVVGSLLLGLGLGAVLALVAYGLGRRSRNDSAMGPVLEAAAKRYLHNGVFHWEYVRGKLRHDPVYRGLLELGALPDEGTLLDLGCGRGILLNLIVAAREQHAAAMHGADWPRPPANLILHGVEHRPKIAAVARASIGEHGRITIADVREHQPQPCDVAILLDVLHYLDPAAQLALLKRTCRALRPGGLLIVREPDAAQGLRFALTRWAEWINACLRLNFGQRFAYRTAEAWCRALEDLGFTIERMPMSQGTPFSNVLMVARLQQPHENTALGDGALRSVDGAHGVGV